MPAGTQGMMNTVDRAQRDGAQEWGMMMLAGGQDGKRRTSPPGNPVRLWCF